MYQAEKDYQIVGSRSTANGNATYTVRYGDGLKNRPLFYVTGKAVVAPTQQIEKNSHEINNQII